MEINKKIEEFFIKKSKKSKIIVIYWPTWSWKTSLSINIAKNINWEIISTDSRQIYKYLDIWTGKITKEEMQWIPHYMLDIINPDQKYSVWAFKQESQKIINKIYKNKKIPILVGWTWLYIDSLIYDFDIPKVPANLNLRKILEQEALNFWKEYVWNKLFQIDPKYAKELHPNNLLYVIRAIEVKTLTWKSKKDFKKQKNLKYDTLFLTPYNGDRNKLYNYINQRVQKMFDDWLIQEVQNILKMWYQKDFPWLKTIWYKEVIDYLDWNISLQESINDVKKHNRNYAKRQLTWFSAYQKYK